jgi:predicted methyltransferase MtxX (methanogen marker protein 4)
LTLNLISDSLYFGDYSHRNTLVRGHIGGVSGGRIYMTGRHVEIDGKITANGKSPDTQLGNNAGKKTDLCENCENDKFNCTCSSVNMVTNCKS